MNVCITWFRALFALALLPAALRAQPASLEFEHLTTLDGLSQDIVSSIHRDRFGFIWIATEDGLNRYDGYSITIYKHDPNNPASLPGNWISGIWDYGEEDLLIATNRGPAIYRRESDSFRPPGGALAAYAGAWFTHACRDTAGNLWMIVGTSTLIRCSSDLSHAWHYDLTPENHLGTFGALAVDARGRVVASAGAHLLLFEPGHDDPVVVPLVERSSAGTAPVEPHALLARREGGLWIGADNGLYRFEERDPFLEHLSLDRSDKRNVMLRDHLFDLTYDHLGRLWCAGFGGLYCYDPASGGSLSYRNLHSAIAGPNPPRIYSVYVDPSDILWVGSWRDGIWKANLHHAQFGLLRHSSKTPFAGGGTDIAAIAEDQVGNIWLGDARSGVTILDPRTNTTIPFAPLHGDGKLSGSEISAMAGDTLGNVWIASAHDIIDGYNIHTGVMRHVHLPLKDDGAMMALALHLDGRGDLWIGTEVDGVFRYTPGTRTLVAYGERGPDPGSRAIRSCWVFFSDHDGNLWAGGWSGNSDLFRFDARNREVREYADAPLQAARAIVEDSDGVLWIGTWGNGLTRFDPKTGQTNNFDEPYGLPSNYIKGMLRDDHGALWISTERGLSVFTPSSGSFRNYDVNDGLQGNFFYSGSCLRARNGKFYFGGTGGANGFFPDSIRMSAYSAPVVLTGFRVNGEQRHYGRAVETLDHVEVSYLDDVLGFEFVALDYRAPGRNRCAYMMEGFNGAWIEAGARRYAEYTHLDPGEYVFKVKGTNSDGQWNPVPASLRLTIVPVYWQTWWFRGALVLVALGMLWLLYRYRVGKLLELERTRSAIATDLHDDIGTGLTNIALFSDLAKRDIAGTPGSIVQRLEKISTTSRELLDAMNDIVWSIKPENDALEQTILRMEDYAVEILEDAGIDLSVEIPDHLRTLKLPMVVRRNLFLIFKEAIGNVLKHADATTLDVAITLGNSGQGERGLLLSIRDNGKGFRVGHQRLGNGLQNMDTRAHALRGTVRVTSAPGEGTSVTIWLPLNSPI